MAEGRHGHDMSMGMFAARVCVAWGSTFLAGEERRGTKIEGGKWEKSLRTWALVKPVAGTRLHLQLALTACITGGRVHLNQYLIEIGQQE